MLKYQSAINIHIVYCAQQITYVETIKYNHSEESTHGTFQLSTTKYNINYTNIHSLHRIIASVTNVFQENPDYINQISYK